MAEPLKNQYDRPYMQGLAAAVNENAPRGIDETAFVTTVFASGWDQLELKGRMRRICESLHAALPAD